MPYPGPAVMMPAKPRLSAWVWGLAALAVVLLAAVVGFGLRYQSVRVANERQMADRAAQIDELEAKLQRLDDERKDLEVERDELLARLDGTLAQIGQHSSCPDAVTAFGEALSSGTLVEQNTAFDAMIVACDVRL